MGMQGFESWMVLEVYVHGMRIFDFDMTVQPINWEAMIKVEGITIRFIL